MPPTPPSADVADRHLAVAVAPARWTASARRWALVVGISRYAHAALNLEWAHRDAEELAALLQTPAGGGFEQSQVVKLVDADATTARVTHALRTFLKKPGRDDLVLLYFACHGAPDPDRPKNLYLLTHDADPADVAGTALPMREIQLCIQENLEAERVVLLADTCHGAAVGRGRRGDPAAASAIHTYLAELGRSKPGTAVFTSAEAAQTAREDARWGGGHGVFTHFLLEGMRGAADGWGGRRPDGIVTLGELLEYVRESVRRETGDLQHPAIGSDVFDRELPIAVIAGDAARGQLELGRGLLAVARLRGEPARYRAAADALAEAIRLAGAVRAPLAEANVGLGEALLGAGEHAEAARVLAAAADAGGAEAAQALPLLALARWRLRDADGTRATLERLAAAEPSERGWIEAHVERAAGGRRRALLVGINQYRMKAMELGGCVNDVALLRKALVGRCRFAPDDVVTLTDRDATREGVERALGELAAGSRAGDTVVFAFSGHSIPDPGRPKPPAADPGREVYLILHDTAAAGDGVAAATSISARRLHELLAAIPAGRVTALLDTHPSAELVGLAREARRYALLVASHADELTYEATGTVDGKTVPAGAFTAALCERLEAADDPEALTFGALADAMVAAMRKRGFDQTPLLVGDRDAPILGEEHLFLRLLDLATRRSFGGLRAGVPEGILERLRAAGVRFAAGYDALGRALLERGSYALAVEALERAGRTDAGDRTILLAHALAGAGRWAEAAALLPRGGAAPAGELGATLDRLVAARRRALLVAIEPQRRRPGRAGARDDVAALRDALVERCGFAPGDVTVLVDGQATRDAIAAAYAELAAASRAGFGLFCFAGACEVASTDELLLLAAGPPGAGLSTSELSAAGPPAETSLAGILDCDLRQPAPRRERVARDLAAAPAGELPRWFAVAACQVEAPAKPASAPQRLTRALVRELRRDAPGRSWRELFDDAARAMGGDETATFSRFGPDLDAPALEDARGRARALEQFESLEREPFARLAALLERTVAARNQQNDPYPAGRLHLGVAYALAGEEGRAIEVLNQAQALYDSDEALKWDPAAAEHEREAHYQLGRVLHESGHDATRAVSELTVAVERDPDDARAHYFLGQAIRAMVERETLARAESAFRRYLESGAPLGHEDEVRAFLATRRERAR
jgi:tetratricopeptide (TPR) repeat protein